MGEVLLLLVVALTVAAVVFGVTVLVSGRDPGLAPAEPDGRAVPLPGGRPLLESDLADVRFDTALRGYRMAQVDQAMRRAAYDIGYKSELIDVLEAEVLALREGRTADADALRRAREEAAGVGSVAAPAAVPGLDTDEESAAVTGPGTAGEPEPAAVPAAGPDIVATPQATGAVPPTPGEDRNAAADPTVADRPGDPAEPDLALRPSSGATTDPAAGFTGRPGETPANGHAGTGGATAATGGKGRIPERGAAVPSESA